MDGWLEAPAAPRPLDAPPARGRVLCVAPHPDDETIGPGATLVLHRSLGDPVGVLFVTSGEAGDPARAADPAAYAALRRREAEEAAAVLDVRILDFWGYPDSRRVHENDLAGIVPRMVELLERERPDVVYVPHPGDQHSDHYACAVIVSRALASLERPPEAWGYEVWSASPAEAVVDVSACYERKMDALGKYRSQLSHTDIERHIRGLNAYRAVFLAKGARWGEAFVRVLPDPEAGRTPP